MPASIDEIPMEGEDPESFVVRVARDKGMEVASRVSQSIVLSADTIVTIDGNILGKPAGKDDAISVGTFDGDEPTLALVRQGDIIKADVASGVYENGWTVVDAALRLEAGQTIPDNIENPTQLLMTQDSAPKSGTYEGADGFRDQFQALWRVS